MKSIEPVKAWQCIGCGSIEAPQTCIGVCEHRKVEFVYASEHAQVVSELERTRAELEAFRNLAHQLAHITPHDGAWQSSYVALQRQARELLAPAHAGRAAAKPSSSRRKTLAEESA